MKKILFILTFFIGTISSFAQDLDQYKLEEFKTPDGKAGTKGRVSNKQSFGFKYRKFTEEDENGEDEQKSESKSEETKAESVNVV